MQVIGNFVKSNGTGPNQLDNVGEKLELFAPGSFDGAKFDRWPVDVIRSLNLPVSYALLMRDRYNSSAPWLPSTAGQGAFLVRKCLRAFADEPLNWYPSDQAAWYALSRIKQSSLMSASNATCARVDECTDTTCSGAGAGGLCACSYDMTTPAVCASPTTIFPPPTNTTGTTSGAIRHILTPCEMYMTPNSRQLQSGRVDAVVALHGARTHFSFITYCLPLLLQCGGGLRWSSRAVVMRPKNGGTSCPMPLEKSESCNTQVILVHTVPSLLG